jgi:hypothetical protein
MKHIIAGKHGHHYQMLGIDKDKPGVKIKWKEICISRSEAASSDFMSEEIVLREKLSLKWNVCMWCWTPDPKQCLYGHPKGKGSVLIARECGFGKCPAWSKPKRRNGILGRKKKNGV